MGSDRQDGGSERPLFKLSIGQLEGMFAAAGPDAKKLRALDRELQFRETDRAARLRKRVACALIDGTNPPSAAAELRARPSPSRQATKARPPGLPHAAGKPRLPVPRAVAAVKVSVPDRKPPKTANEPGAILAAWTALEALSPQTYRRPEDMAAGDKRCVADLTQGALPWEAGQRSRKNYRLYYRIILGAIPLATASARLVEAFGDDEERGPRPREKAAIAAILVDRDGILAGDNAVSLSSFAWALPLALQLKLDVLGSWPEVERDLIEQLDAKLRRHDDEGKPLPLNRATIGQAHDWLVQHLDLPADLVEPPSFAVRIYHYYKAKHDPEAALLNSFFLGDLARSAALVRQKQAPAGLRQYLGMAPPRQTIDLLADREALEAAVAPAMMPLARWPHPGGHSLVLLQQAAINLARSELAGGEGMIAVNGPPGTGKTTLLRDLVAASVLDRALAMAAFDDPDTAFTASGEKVPAGDKGVFKLYTLAPSLKGHEIVVASSNNKAVENVSRELPAVTAIGRSLEDLSYFPLVGALLQNSARAAAVDEEGTLPDEPVESWGMIAAVLGNRRNVAAFQQSFWWDDERSFRLYLKAAKGDDVSRDIQDPDTGAATGRRPPAIVTAEHPPLPDEAPAAWRDARERLLRLRQDVEAELRSLEEIRQLCRTLSSLRAAMTRDETTIADLLTKRKALGSELSRFGARIKTCRHDQDHCDAALARSRTMRPGIMHWALRTARWKSWAQAHAPVKDAAALAARRRGEAEQGERNAAATLAGLTRDLVQIEAHHTDLKQQASRLSRDLDRHRPALGDRIVDDELFEQGHGRSHKASPWLPDSVQRKREDLFIAALAVHRAFIDVAARKVYHNLGALMDVFASGPPQEDAKRKALGDLWSTLHLAVPVVSTTFASVDRMLGALPPGSIGWLLIDEAGQAHPQAAVGAISRARRIVVVGDPLQIQPVVPMPERLNADICRFFKVDPATWSAPNASAQTVADRTSRFQAAFRSADGVRRVGIPLLVHRRCQEPMFGMFNRIAYDGQMVQGTPLRDDSAIGAALGPSKWFDVKGAADTKWCPAEGEAVVGLLKTMAAAGVRKPDLFIVTPFRIVAQELRRRLEQEHALFAALEIDSRSWIADRVGTIHTVQGREADAVMLVLGAPNPKQSRARIWAAETPNVFNVALSRARQSFYVVGSRDAWAGVGHGQELASLPAERIALGGDTSACQPDQRQKIHESMPKETSQQHRRGPSI